LNLALFYNIKTLYRVFHAVTQKKLCFTMVVYDLRINHSPCKLSPRFGRSKR